MAMSSHSEFINDGSRDNRGIVNIDPDSVQPRGVIMGVVGTRFILPLTIHKAKYIEMYLQTLVLSTPAGCSQI